MQILVDQDGVLADFELGFYNAWQATEYAKEFPAIEVASRNVFYIARQYPAHFKEQVYELITKKGFFENLPPIDGAVEALIAMQDAGHDVVICTSPMDQWQNCVAEKYAWVEKHLGHEWTKRMIITKDKTLVRGDVIIDDKPMVTGLMTPVWTHILYDSPYNRAENNVTLQDELIGKPRLTWADWQAVVGNFQP